MLQDITIIGRVFYVVGIPPITVPPCLCSPTFLPLFVSILVNLFDLFSSQLSLCFDTPGVFPGEVPVVLQSQPVTILVWLGIVEKPLCTVSFGPPK